MASDDAGTAWRDAARENWWQPPISAVPTTRSSRTPRSRRTGPFRCSPGSRSARRCARSGGAEPYLGWNVEDLSLVRVLHAEQAAIVAALHREEAGVRITDLAIWGDGDVPPCGACRQMISDYGPQARVLFPYRGGILITSAGQLLPLAFRIRPAR